MATYTGRIDNEPNPHHDESHLAYALARDIELGRFDSKLDLLAMAIEERAERL